MELAVTVSALTCQFGGLLALDDLSLEIPVGQVVGLVGPNGAGKTTLLDVVSGLLRPTTGTVTVFGQDVARRGREVRAQLGVVPQETALYEEVSARQNLRFAAALYDVVDEKARVEAVLAVVGLTARGDDAVRTLSGGMQRRLAIARALLHEPRMLILDEPTLGVDIEARHQIWSHVRKLRGQGKTVLLSTNYLDEAEALCDRVVMLRAGKKVAEDSPRGLLARAGRCVELECAPGEAVEIEKTLVGSPGVLRIETADLGLVAYIEGSSSPEDLVRRAMQVCPLSGFRIRSPDLVEVFRALGRQGGQERGDAP
jgi:ABC-2 type transport system ATP-binding protein